MMSGLDIDDSLFELPPSVKLARSCENGSKPEKKTAKKKGGYKAVLVDLDDLKNEAEYMEAEISTIIAEWRNGTLSNQDVTCLYIILYLFKRYSNKFLGNQSPVFTNEELEHYKVVESSALRAYFNSNAVLERRLKDARTHTIFDLINTFNLHCIPRASRVALAKWYLNIYDIVPILHVATAQEVIRFQANRQRCVTLATKNLDELIEGHRDALSFVIHDLQHAFKMFNNEVLLQGQVAFSILMLKVVECDFINEFLENDSEFQESFYYLVSDMNSHTRHLFFHFKTCLINAFKKKHKLERSEHLSGAALDEFNAKFEFLLELFGMNEAEKQSAKDVLSHCDASNQFNCFDFTILNDFFLNLYDSKFNKSTV